MEKNWADRLKDNESVLTRREQVLIRFITENPHEAAFLRQSDLCRMAGVSKPLVISCFRKLGYGEYRDFQEGLRTFYATRINSYSAGKVAFRDMESLGDLITAAFTIEQDTLESLKEAADNNVESLARTLLDARSVFIFTDGTGRYPGHYLWQRLCRCGIDARLTGGDRIHWIDEMSSISSEDVFLSFFYSGDKNYHLKVLEYLNVKKCSSWIITGLMDHELAQNAGDLVFVPRGQLNFKNSMAAPMMFSHLILLATEFLGGPALQDHLKEVEDYRKDLE